MKILVADDSKAMRMIVIRNLKSAGFSDATFSEAENGKQGLDSVKADKPDLILSDWNMPEMNGLEFCQAVTAEGIDVTFGFVTSESTADMRSLAEEAGAKFLIAKPFTPQAFQEAISLAVGS